MHSYNELYIDVILFEIDDIVRTSPGGVDYGKDSGGNDLGWGE